MNGRPISVTRCVFVLTANCSLSWPDRSTLASVRPNTSSVLWSNFAFGNERRMARRRGPAGVNAV